MTEKIDWQPGMVAKCVDDSPHFNGHIPRFNLGEKLTVTEVFLSHLRFEGGGPRWSVKRFKPVYRVKAQGVRVPHAFNRQEHWDMLLASVPGRCEMVSV